MLGVSSGFVWVVAEKISERDSTLPNLAPGLHDMKVGASSLSLMDRGALAVTETSRQSHLAKEIVTESPEGVARESSERFDSHQNINDWLRRHSWDGRAANMLNLSNSILHQCDKVPLFNEVLLPLRAEGHDSDEFINWSAAPIIAPCSLISKGLDVLVEGRDVIAARVGRAISFL